MNTTFIYALIDPIEKEVRYVGKSDNPYKRLVYGHLKDNGRFYKANWIRSLMEKGLCPTICILEECDKDVWDERERDWINFGHKIGWPLTNLAKGGAGGSFKGRIHKEETKIKIGNAHRGSRRSDEARRKMSESHRRARKPRSEETKRKISNAQKGKFVSEETRKKLSDSHKGLPGTWIGRRHTEETRRKMMGHPFYGKKKNR